MYPDTTQTRMLSWIHAGTYRPEAFWKQILSVVGYSTGGTLPERLYAVNTIVVTTHVYKHLFRIFQGLHRLYSTPTRNII